MAVDDGLFEQYDQALTTVTKLVKRETILPFLKAKKQAALGTSEEEIDAYLLSNLLRLKQLYGDVACETAKEFYEQQRALSGVSSTYDVTFSGNVPDRFVLQDLQDAVAVQRKSKTFDYDALCDAMVGHMVKYTVRASDLTMIGNARRDPAHPKWALVPHIGACAWCCLLGSQGFVYHSKGTATAARHTHCACPVIVDFDVDNPSLKGYDPDGINDRLMSIGSLFDTSDYGRILKEAPLFDREWIRTGKIPTISYLNPDARDFKRKDTSHYLERRTANILRRYGFAPVFCIDERQDFNNLGKTIGFADLASGLEIKTMDNATKVSTFASHIRKSKKKTNFKLLAFDLSQNNHLSDDQCREIILKAMNQRHLSHAIFIDHTEVINYVHIKTGKPQFQ